MDSRVLYGTSRGKINSILYEWTKKFSLITVLFNHKLTDMDFEKKEITLEKRENGEKIIVIVKADKVIAADGLYSMVRRQMDCKC